MDPHMAKQWMEPENPNISAESSSTDKRGTPAKMSMNGNVIGRA
jgi:hypothetical protein